MRGCSRILEIMLVVASLLAAAVLFGPRPLLAQAAAAAAAQGAPLAKPQWEVGDSWVIETLTQRVQGRETESADGPVRLRWQFHVAKIEKLAGNDCYRVDIQCLTPGRVRPNATMWCDQQNLFLRQFQTQVVFQGKFRTIQESYVCAKGETAPVVAFVNVLPLAMPAFIPAGAKGGDTFTFTSLPLPAGSKDVDLVRFAHTAKQQVRPADAKSLERIPPKFAKALAPEGVAEVTLARDGESLVQLWQPGNPWPVYAENARTRAWLVSETSR